MGDWLPAVIAAAAAISGIVIGWTGRAREARRETRTETREDTLLRADVEYIKRGVDEMRIEMRATGQRLDGFGERLTRAEESSKQAHKRLDEHLAVHKRNDPA